MHHTFRFAASRFNSSEPKSYFINDRCFGDDVVAWLRAGLLEMIQDADIGEPIQEDYGWGFWLEFGGDRFWVYAGLMDRDASNAESAWLAAIEHHEPMFVRRPGGVVRQQTRFDALVAAVRTVITADPAIRLLGENDD